MDNIIYNSPVGRLRIISDGEAITKVEFLHNVETLYEVHETELLKNAAKELDEYFEARRKKFTIPLNPKGTEFQLKVWMELIKIPYGETRAYSEIAAEIGSPKACRAVGMANNKNSIPIFIPCHRVIGKNGTLTGYADGISIKEKLLKLEQNH